MKKREVIGETRDERKQKREEMTGKRDERIKNIGREEGS